MKRFRICCLAAFLFLTISCPAFPSCLPVQAADDEKVLKIDDAVLGAIGERGLKKSEFYHVLQIVARYETNGCWSGAAGNSDNQWLSVGVMQWNFGRNTLQQFLHDFKDKFSPSDTFEKELNRLMPKYGSKLFASACRTKPIGPPCKTFLKDLYVGPDSHLAPDFKSELEALFDSADMRQIQVDRFGRALTSVLDDMDRVFGKRHYAAWQIAWAMDLKTQQGRFPKDSSIRHVREEIRKSEVPIRKDHLMGFINWYESESRSPYAIGVKDDWDYNTKTWRHEVMADFVDPDREEVLHFTWLVSHTAANKDGAYQADAFERRATIAFGKGSVHGHVLDFSQD